MIAGTRSDTWADEALPVVTVSPSSGWPESDLIYRGTVYRYQGGLRWKRDDTWTDHQDYLDSQASDRS